MAPGACDSVRMVRGFQSLVPAKGRAVLSVVKSIQRYGSLFVGFSSTITSTGQKSNGLSTSTKTARTAPVSVSKFLLQSPVHLSQVGLGLDWT